MMTKEEKQKRHIARKIEKVLGFTNGWKISDIDYTYRCQKLASEIHKYLKSKK